MMMYVVRQLWDSGSSFRFRQYSILIFPYKSDCLKVKIMSTAICQQHCLVFHNCIQEQCFSTPVLEKKPIYIVAVLYGNNEIKGNNRTSKGMLLIKCLVSHP